MFPFFAEIVHGDKKKSPIFVVEIQNNPEIVFRSYVATKAWKKALAHFESLSSEQFEAAVADAVIAPFIESEQLGFLTAASGEDGFGLLRRNITRVLEGLHQVLRCTDYQFWEERHVVNADVHTKLRAKLSKQVREFLSSRANCTKEEIERMLSQESVLLEYSRSPEEHLRHEEKERREAEKRSVREAARKLLEIEMKVQEDEKEAQRREKEDRRNALAEAKMEASRQKEARKEALRLAKDEERRMREEEKESKRLMKEEEKRKKVEDKENSMKRRIEELRERRKMREEQKSILENGVVTTSHPARSSADAIRITGDFHRDLQSPDSFQRKKHSSGLSPGSRCHTSSVRKQQLALLKFVDEEKDRRRKMRLLEKKFVIEKDIWMSVKAEYLFESKHPSAPGSGAVLSADQVMKHAMTIKPTEDKLKEFIIPTVELHQVPTEYQGDLLFAWDFLSTFADCLRLTTIPSLDMFVKILTLSDGSSPVGDGNFEEDSLGRVYAGFHAEVVRALMSEYFPFLQTGTRLDEFYRTRPLNAFSWPELARQVCMLAIELKHPSADDQLVKSLKGSKSYRDDSVVLPLRHRLQKRGVDLLNGVQYQESLAATESSSETSQTITREAVPRQLEGPAATSSSKFYGVVLVNGVSTKLELEEKEQHLAVKRVISTGDNSTDQHDEESAQDGDDTGDDNAVSINVGDYLISVNGVSVKGMTLNAFSSVLNGLPVPHGLLLSSTVPPAKAPMKHIPTTMNSSKVKRCAHVLKLLRAKEIAGPFNQPVDPDLYPDYYSGIITEPMDLGTIAEKLEDEDYENDDDVETFVEDVGLVWKNCYTYNSVKAEISHLAKKLSVIFERLMNDWVYSNVSRHLVSSEEDHCRNCQTNHVKDRLLLCDRCDAAYHTFCLSSPLSKIPTGEWFCPVCVSDPNFSADQSKRKIGEGLNGNGKIGGSLEAEIEYSEFEKRVLSVIEVLSRENYSELPIGDRVSVLRVLCELLQQTSAVQSVYQTIEEKAIDARREFGDALADLNREWDLFEPSQHTHTIDRTNKFFVDGVEHDLTDELLDYLKEKAHAELEGKPIPPLPESSMQRLHKQHGVQQSDEDRLRAQLSDIVDGEASEDSGSEPDEEQLLESFSDRFLLASQSEEGEENGGAGDVLSLKSAACEFCGLEDGILNGALLSCKRCPMTLQVTPLDHFELPELLGDGELDQIFSARRFTPEECASVQLVDTPEGVQLGDQHNLVHDDMSSAESAPTTIYAINDRVVYGLKSTDMLGMIRRAKQPILIYLTSLPGDVVKASVSIVEYHSIPLGLNLTAAQSFMFVQSFVKSADFPVGYGELSQQILPGDVILLVNEVSAQGKELAEVEQLVQLDNKLDTKYVVAMRAPCGKMKLAVDSWSKTASDISTQRSKRSALRKSLIPSRSSEPKILQAPKRKFIFDVTFYDGPLGLALSLETCGVIVKSLNDHPNGVLGQASLSRQIRCGDLVESVNGQVYGPLRDLSQFTSFLLGLPRPLVITFSREAEKASQSSAALLQPALEGLRDPDFVRTSLSLPSASAVKAFQVDRMPFPFVVAEFLGSLCVVSTNGYIACESMKAHGDLEDNLSAPRIAVGDCIVGVNGQSTAGLTWTSLQSVCAELANLTPLYFHLVPHAPKKTLVRAHKTCARTANLAWSECESLLPKIEEARKFEHFLTWTVVPRTLPLGRCRGGYTFYRFYNDHQRIYLQSQEKQWFVCGAGTSIAHVLNYLDQNHRDIAIAKRIRASYHHLLHDKSASSNVQQVCCEYSELPFLMSGPFALKKDVSVSMTEFDTEKHEAFISYRGRKYCVGEFSAHHQAQAALQHAESLVLARGSHIATDKEVHGPPSVLFPTLPVPVVKAEGITKRPFARKYEYIGGILDSAGKPKLVPLSQSVFHVLRRGLRPEYVPAAAVQYQPSSHQLSPNAQDQMKRKHTTLAGRDASMYQHEQLKRAKFGGETSQFKKVPIQSAPNATRPYQPVGSTEPSAVSFKRSLQPLVDQGRAMLAAWNQFAVSPTVQTSSGLAFTCLSSFEEVKKAVSRVLVDPHGVHPDPKTFVCLHHAFVVGLICAMATQSLTNSQKTTADSAFVKQIADAFATAILSCMDPSTMLRARALSGFAMVAKQCEPAARPSDLSEGLHHVANFALQFFRSTQYLADGNFEDTTNCRPIFSSLSRGVENLPASFLQQIRLLENIREAFVQKTEAQSTATPASNLRAPPINLSMPSLNASLYTVPAQARQDHVRAQQLPSTTFTQGVPENGKETYVHVTFGLGPLGVVINYSNRATVIVTEFSGDNGMMGQAQASGKVLIGDEIFSVNGMYLDSIGMEGFKTTVATGGRPLQVTLRRYVSPIEPIGSAQGENGMGLRRQAQNAASVFDYDPVNPTGAGQQQVPFNTGMNQLQQPQSTSYVPPIASPENGGYYADGAGGVGDMTAQQANADGMYQASSSSYSNMADNLTPFPFESAPIQSSGDTGGIPASAYDMPSSSTTSPFMGSMPAPYPSSASSHANSDTLPALYDEPDVGSLQPLDQWQDPSPAPMRNFGQEQSLPSISGYSYVGDMNMSSGPPMGSMNPQQFGLQPMYASQDQQQTPVLPSMAQLPNGGTSFGSNATSDYDSFVAPNDPNIAQDDGQISYYDTNDTTYRSGFGFAMQMDEQNGLSAAGTGDEMMTSGLSDAETEAVSPSVSQLTTPAQSDTEGDDGATQSQLHRRQEDIVRLNAISSAFQATAQQSADHGGFYGSSSQAATSAGGGAVVGGGRAVQADDESAEAVQGRRSTRVPKKITSNIADMYNPDFAKNANLDGAVQEPTDGEVGELATELLEPFQATIRRAKPGISRSVIFLKAQLLTMEAATPREAFRSGRWSRPIRAAWAEMVYGCDTAYTLMEGIVFLESNIEAEWLDSCWKASPLQTARNALASATIASAALRLFALDDAISYVRMKRSNKRKPRIFNSSSQISPTKESDDSPSLTHPSQLPFMNRFTPATLDVVNRTLHRVCVGQRDKTMSPYLYRKVSAQMFIDC